jgi:arsenate reductase
MKKTRVLFLSTANAARSQIAEAALRKYGGENFESYSAGLEPTEINADVRKVMEEAGVSLEGQYAKDVREYMGKVHFGYLITVCEDAERNCPSTFPGMGQRLHWSFDSLGVTDGTPEEHLAKSRRVRDEIEARVQTWITEMRQVETARMAQ